MLLIGANWPANNAAHAQAPYNADATPAPKPSSQPLVMSDVWMAMNAPAIGDSGKTESFVRDRLGSLYWDISGTKDPARLTQYACIQQTQLTAFQILQNQQIIRLLEEIKQKE